MESVDGEGDLNWKRNLTVAVILLVFTILAVVAGITGALK